MYGAYWLNGSKSKDFTIEYAKLIEPRIEGFARGTQRLALSREVVKVLASLIEFIPGMRVAVLSALGVSTSNSIPDEKEAALEAEENFVAAIKEDVDSIILPIYSLLNLSERKYHDLIDNWGNTFNADGEKTQSFSL